MKKRTKIKFTLLVSSFFIPQAFAEFRVGNGGDAMAAEFIELADETLQQVEKLLHENDVLLQERTSLEELKRRIATAVVYTKDKTFVDANEVDALNFPEENKIVLNRNRWKSLAFSLKGLKTLVLHEYLTMAGADDKSYQVSNFIVRKIFNGGTKGELWHLKDLADRKQSNPFFSAWFEINGSFLRGQKTRYFQNGLVLSENLVDSSRAHCKMVLTGKSLDASGNNTRIRLPVMSSTSVKSTASSVEIDLQKPVLISKFVCTSGSGEMVTVKDLLDSIPPEMSFQHQGKNSIGSCEL